jgi:2-haloacid dehalogenase
MPAFESPSTGLAIRAVLFDTFGTVVDWRAGISAAVAAFSELHHLGLDADDFADRWRGEYQPAMEPIRSGEREYTTLDRLHRENLDVTLRLAGHDPAAFEPAELGALAHSWRRLAPWPDAVEGLLALKREYVIGPLSNGNTALLLTMAKNGSLPWDVIVGSDMTRSYKPHPEAYLRTAALLDLQPGELMLAAAHNDDLAAARRAGLATAFLPRPTEHGPGQTVDLGPADDWDVVAADIRDLARRLGA